MFFDSFYYKNSIIYKPNRSLLNKPQPSHLFNGFNGLVFVVSDKAELIVDSLEWKCMTYFGPDIPDIVKNYYYIKNIKINKSNLFTTPETVKFIIQNLQKEISLKTTSLHMQTVNSFLIN